MDEIIFDFVERVKLFNALLTNEYKLTESPYNLSGKAFPKTGFILYGDIKIRYNFHGRGCTFYMDEIEVNFNVDASNIHQIMIGSYSIKKFIETSNYHSFKFMKEINEILELCEEKGVLMKRLPNDLGSWHVNEAWYNSIKKGNGVKNSW